jgi:hypothetical protein
MDFRDRLQSHRLGAAFCLGIAVALLVTTPGRDGGSVALSPGWVGLWLATTLGAAPLGVMLLAAPGWRAIPIDDRRGPAAAYLAVCLLNATALAALLQRAFGLGSAILLPAFFVASIGVLFLRLYPAAGSHADLFP